MPLQYHVKQAFTAHTRSWLHTSADPVSLQTLNAAYQAEEKELRSRCQFCHRPRSVVQSQPGTPRGFCMSEVERLREQVLLQRRMRQASPTKGMHHTPVSHTLRSAGGSWVPCPQLACVCYWLTNTRTPLRTRATNRINQHTHTRARAPAHAPMRIRCTPT